MNKIEATVGNITVAVVDGAVVLGDGKGEVKIPAGTHKDVSKMITRLLRVSTGNGYTPIPLADQKKRGRKAKTAAKAEVTTPAATEPAPKV